MSFKYIDAHCHIQFDMFDKDQEELIERMRAEGVAGIVVGCDLDSSKKAVALAEKHKHLFAAVGVHPNHEADEWYEAKNYQEFLKHPKVVAVGECGLDYFRPVQVDDELKRKQKAMLIDHFELAALADKPLIIHSRPSKGTQDAYQDLIVMLKEAKVKYPNLRGDIHFFVGGVAEAEALIALGFTLSFTAVVTFAREYDRVIKTVPLESILSETDSPYVPPTNRARGSRNDPLAVTEVVRQIAEIRGEDLEKVRQALLQNAQKLFALPS